LAEVPDDADVPDDAEEVDDDHQFAEPEQVSEDDQKQRNPLRKTVRELERKNKQLAKELEAMKAPKPVEIGEKPNIEQFDYDDAAYDAALLKWYEAKSRADSEKQQAEQAKLSLQEQYTKAANRIPDYKSKEAAVCEVLSVAQQGLLLEALGENAPKLVAALARDADRLDGLAEISNPIKFVKELTKLEGQIVSKPSKSTKPQPHDGLRNSAPVKNGNLERLRAQAQKTGDYTAYHAAQRAIRESS
jgi:hypothetical protein